MSVCPFLVAELARLRDDASNTPVSVQACDPSDIQVVFDLVQVESLSCEFPQITLHVPATSQSAFDVLK